MSTRSSARNLFPPLDNLELTIRRRYRVDPTLLNDFEMATDGNDDPPVPDLRTMEEFIKVNGVTDDALHLYLFPHSLTHHATAWFDRLPKNSVTTFEQMAKIFLGKYFPHLMVMKLRNEITNLRQRPENMTAHHNDWDTSAQWSESSSSITSSSDLEIVALKAEMAKINKNLMKPPLAKPKMYMLREPTKVIILTNLKNFQNQNRNQGNNHGIPQRNNQGRNQFFQGASHGQNPPPAYQALGYQAQVHQPLIPQLQVVTTTEFTNYMKANDAILKNMQTNMTTLTNSNLELKNMFGQFMKMNTASSSGSGTLPKRETEVTKDTVPPTNNGSTKYVQPLVVQIKTPIPNSEPVVALIVEPVVAPVSALKPNPKPSIPYPSRLHDQKLHDKANDQKEKFFQIFKDLDFNISFADALILMPNFGPTIKSLLSNKDKLFELARTLLTEHCLAVLLKKLPEKLGDPDKFLIPCDFPRMDECLALANLGASINLMPLSSWNKLSLLELTPTLMTLELTDRELTLRVDNEAVTFNLDQTSRYSANYNDMTANRIDVIDMDSLLTDDPSLPPPTQGMYLPQIRKEIKICEAKYDKSLIDEPPEVELKDLPPHLEYTFLEGDDKLPVIISEDLSVEEKAALIKISKSPSHHLETLRH
nr:reverse transcriptase domain-containing protein [Tanacetum cinerariifolium]